MTGLPLWNKFSCSLRSSDLIAFQYSRRWGKVKSGDSVRRVFQLGVNDGLALWLVMVGKVGNTDGRPTPLLTGVTEPPIGLANGEEKPKIGWVLGFEVAKGLIITDAGVGLSNSLN